MQKSPIIVGISGPSASGKNQLAMEIFHEYKGENIAILREDTYYKDYGFLPFEERMKINYDNPDALEHTLLQDHLQDLKRGEAIEMPLYNHALCEREKKTKHLASQPLILVIGMLLFANPNLRDLFDLRIFMDTPLDLCLINRLKRDIMYRHRTIDFVLHQYETHVRPMYDKIVKPQKKHAQMVISLKDSQNGALDQIQAKLKELTNGFSQK